MPLTPRSIWSKVNTALDLEQAVNWLKETHSVDVISTSIGWYNASPGDGTGFFADLVAGARSADILWATAAGNERESHWGGGYVDSDSDDIHEFYGQEVNYFGPGDGDCYAIEAGYGLPVFLSWDDWDDVNQDYDLLLLRWNGSGWEIIATGEDLQTGLPGQTPTEVAYSPSIGSATCYGFVIRRYNATRNVHFEVFAPAAPHLDEFTPERSLVNLADAPDAMTVAALDVTSPYPQESYSSEGPTNGPGGTATGGIIKPDIAAFANVATESYGGSAFNGTSSATPHVSGAAALVLSAYPSYSADQLQSLLEERAIDMGPSGMDTRFGHGRLYLGAPTPPQNDGPEISVSPTTLSVAQARDSQTSRTLSISNSGDETLTWTISESQAGEAGCASPTSISWLSVNPVSGSTPATSDSSVTVTFDSTGLTPNTYIGALCIDSNDPDTPLVSISVQQIVQDTSTEADLAVSIVDAVDPVKQGDNIEYTVTVDNFGPEPANAVKVTNMLPSNVTFVPALSSTSCALSGGEVACDLGTLANGSNEDVTIVVRTNTNTPASVANTVEVESSTYDPVSGNNSDVEVTTVRSSVYLIYLPMLRVPLRPPNRLEASEDTLVSEGYPGINACDTIDMWAGYDPMFGSLTVRSLIKFDLSEIPPGTAIESATLNVRHYASLDTSRNNAQTITSFRVGSPWSACSTTWSNQPSIGEAYGSVAVPFDTGNWYSIDVTGILQGWVNGAFPNHGLWLRGPETSDNPAFRAFYTEDSSYDPYLSIVYTGAAATAQTEREVVDDEREQSESILTVADLFGVPSANQMCQDIPEGFECMTTP